MIEMRAEISKGVWCRFIWSADTESYRIEWEAGTPPAHPTAAMRKRMDEALSEFTSAIFLEQLKTVTEEASHG